MSDASVSQETLILGVVGFLLESESDASVLAFATLRNFLQKHTSVAGANCGSTLLEELQVVLQDQGMLDDLKRINLETMDGWDDMRKANLDKCLEVRQDAEKQRQSEEAQKVLAAREAEER